MLKVLRGVHWVARKAFERAGYRFEIRKAGDTKLGLWRMEFRKPKRGESSRRAVFVPGFGDTPLSWLWVMITLQPVFRARFDEIIWVDYPGFAGALCDERCFSTLDELLVATSDAFDSLRPETIIAHSLGGWVSAWYAAECAEGQRPKQRSGGYRGPSELVLVSPSGVFASEAEKDDWANLFRSSYEVGFSTLRPRLFAKEPLWFRFVLEEFSGFTRREDIAGFMKSFKDIHRLDKRIEKIEASVWLVWGNRDELVPWTWHRTWLKHLKPNSEKPPRAVLLKGVGHSPQLETPNLIAVVLGQILSGFPPHRAGSRWWELVEAEAEPKAMESVRNSKDL